MKLTEWITDFELDEKDTEFALKCEGNEPFDVEPEGKEEYMLAFVHERYTMVVDIFLSDDDMSPTGWGWDFTVWEVTNDGVVNMDGGQYYGYLSALKLIAVELRDAVLGSKCYDISDDIDSIEVFEQGTIDHFDIQQMVCGRKEVEV